MCLWAVTFTRVSQGFPSPLPLKGWLECTGMGIFLPGSGRCWWYPSCWAHQALRPRFPGGRLVKNRSLWHISKRLLFPLPARSTGLLSDIYYGNLSKLLWATLTIFCGSPDDWVLREFLILRIVHKWASTNLSIAVQVFLCPPLVSAVISAPGFLLWKPWLPDLICLLL